MFNRAQSSPEVFKSPDSCRQSRDDVLRSELAKQPGLAELVTHVPMDVRQEDQDRFLVELSDQFFKHVDTGQIDIPGGTQVEQDPQAQLLCTMPGIGAYSALLILSEIGDIRRFPDGRHLCSYAGLVPSVYASGGKTRLGRLTKQGSKWLRWILVECSVHAITGAPQFRSLYTRVARKHGPNTGRVAVARAMLKTIYAMLTNREAFRPIVKETAGQRHRVMTPA